MLHTEYVEALTKKKRNKMIEVIINEMAKGNFSFPILFVGTAQLVVMIIQLILKIRSKI